MKDSTNVEISEQHVETFSRDGVVFLRNMFSAEWVELLKTGVSRNLANPEKALEFGTETTRGNIHFMILTTGAELMSTENLSLKVQPRKLRQNF